MYRADFELPSAMVSAQVKENQDGTVFVWFENEHGEYGLTLDTVDAKELAGHIAAAQELAAFPARSMRSTSRARFAGARVPVDGEET